MQFITYLFYSPEPSSATPRHRVGCDRSVAALRPLSPTAVTPAGDVCAARARCTHTHTLPSAAGGETPPSFP
eukprot:2565798-Pleurochrysis_carterae.AAC.2